MDSEQDSRPSARRWVEDPAELPWFDQPDATTHIAAVADRWKLGADGEAWLTSWIQHGYFEADTLIPSHVVDALSARIDDVWFRDAVMPGLWLFDIMVGSTRHMSCQHADLLALPLEDRIKAKEASNWRIPGYHQHEPAASDLFELDELKNVCSALFDRQAIPRYSLTFSKGSEQGLHQDICAFHVWPRNYLVGAWVACEDITAESGPLVYCPGTHRSPMYPGFDNYPQTMDRTASPDHTEAYYAFVAAIAKDWPRKEFLARTGSVLFWHGMLIHGGSAITDISKTRKSFVIHYMPDGVDRASEVVGPFNW